MDSENFPLVPKDLLDALNEIVPEQHPSLSDSKRKVWWNAGKRSLVNFLIDKYDLQNQNILNNSTIS
jgi:hypothetical protein